MTLASDLAGVFAETAFTVPVSYGASTTRGFFDRAGTVKKVAGVAIPVEKDTLFVLKTAVPGLAADSTITIGSVGAASAADGVVFRVANWFEVDDGDILAIELTGGRS